MNKITKKLINAKFDKNRLVEFDIIEDFWDAGSANKSSLGVLLGNRESKDALCCLGFCTLPVFKKSDIYQVTFPSDISHYSRNKKSEYIVDLLASQLAPEFTDKLYKKYKSMNSSFMYLLEDKNYECLLANVNDTTLIPKAIKKRIISFIFSHLGVKVSWRKINE